jgi:hypothetical protein
MNLLMAPRLANILALTAPFLVGLILFPRAAVADVPGVPVTLALTGTNNWINMGGVYTSPYQIEVAGATVPSWLVCDDFVTDINIGNQWYADVYTLPQVEAGGPQKFHGTTNAEYTIQQDYYAAAWLAYQLVTDSSIRNDPTTSAYYSFAIWQIFYPAASNGYGGNVLSSDQQVQVNSDTARAYWQTSHTSVMSFLDSRVSIYTPVDTSTSGYIFPSQEFIGVASGIKTALVDAPLPVPEASTVAFLAFDFLALPGIVFLMRRRTRRDT